MGNRRGMDCPHINSCEMYSLFRLAGTLKTWQIRYCSGDYTKCERYKRKKLGHPVPDNLLPSGVLLRFAKTKDENEDKEEE